MFQTNNQIKSLFLCRQRNRLDYVIYRVIFFYYTTCPHSKSLQCSQGLFSNEEPWAQKTKDMTQDDVTDRDRDTDWMAAYCSAWQQAVAWVRAAPMKQGGSGGPQAIVQTISQTQAVKRNEIKFRVGFLCLKRNFLTITVSLTVVCVTLWHPKVAVGTQ